VLFSLVAAAAICVGCAQTDAGVTTKVKANFATDDVVKAYQIDVDTQDHVVTLSGEVDSFTAKQRALSLARQEEGVREVVDHIKVGEGSAALPGEHNTTGTSGRDTLHPTDRAAEAGRDISTATSEAAEKTKAAARQFGEAVTDGSITAAVKSRLLANAAAEAMKIDVTTTDNVVTLTGTVPSAGVKAEVIRAARDTAGVREVKDNMIVAGK
jgi:hyperosmotically inducible protein